MYNLGDLIFLIGNVWVLAAILAISKAPFYLPGRFTAPAKEETGSIDFMGCPLYRQNVLKILFAKVMNVLLHGREISITASESTGHTLATPGNQRLRLLLKPDY